MAVPLVVFLLTYAAISVPRIGRFHVSRTASALAGAVAMVLVSAISLDDAFRAINWDTIALLFAMLVVSGFLADANAFAWLARVTVRHAGSPRRLLVAIVFASGILSAVLVNDTVCLVFAPFVLAVCTDAKLPPMPFLLAVGMGSNIGGAATYTGTPQTMIIGGLSEVSYARYALHAGPVALVSLAVLAVALLVAYRRELGALTLTAPEGPPPPMSRPRTMAVLVVLAALVAAFWLGARLSLASLVAASALLLAFPRRGQHVVGRVDFSLLVFFVGLFVVMAGAARAGVFAGLLDPHASPPKNLVAFTGITVVGSNLVSNVPFVLLVAPWIPRFDDPARAWYVLAVASTFAGNLTILGSVANLIVLEATPEPHRIGFLGFLRIGVPVTLATLGVMLLGAWLLP